jgi:membrane protein YqaA with SNARE-associated domain
MMDGLLTAIEEWAGELGGVGLFVLALLDSSFLSFPQVNDILIIILSTRHPELMPYYAGMSLLGSVIGCQLLYAVIRRGGGEALRTRLKGRYFDRALGLYQKYGLLAVAVPALLPPPVPLKVFILLAATAAMSPLQLVLAIALGRGTRYFGQGYLAVLYGAQAAEFMKRYGVQLGIGVAATALAAGIIAIRFRRRPA